MKNLFEIKDNFYLNGEPFKVISGSMHYFRIVPEYWQDRLEKLKAMGCNTVETYVPWNLHEPKEGVFNFEGQLDLVQFIKVAESLGLYVIVRPSPYICAEWEFGGLPAWLLTKPGIRLRCSNEVFLGCVERYYEALLPQLAPLQITEGGPIIMMQIENEYGYYGDDTTYLTKLKEMMEVHIQVPFVTSDGPTQDCLSRGSVPGVLATGNFGSHTIERFKELETFVGNKPLMCMEFWVGWFDHWGCGKHNTSNLEENKKDLENMLKLGHVNFYMFHGGTNFGFMNGSNYQDYLTPDVTSYDYDAVLTEDGQITEKYLAFKEIIKKFAPVPEVEFSTPIERRAYGTFDVKEKVGLFESLEDLSQATYESMPRGMESFGQNYGYILYRSQLKAKEGIQKCKIIGGADRAVIFVDGDQKTIRYDRELEQDNGFETEQTPAQIDILMENMGRVNYGVRLEEQQKGITRGVMINNAYHMNWEMYPLPLDNIANLDFAKGYTKGQPAFYRYEVEVDHVGDTFIDMSEFGKGCVFVNGVNIGRYWEIGPQKRLYIPGPYLVEGTNEIIVFETDGKASDKISLLDAPDIG